jgi:hypothetical protein
MAAWALLDTPGTTGGGGDHLPATLSRIDRQSKFRVPLVLVLVCIALFILATWRSAATRAALPPEQRRNPDLD